MVGALNLPRGCVSTPHVATDQFGILRICKLLVSFVSVLVWFKNICKLNESNVVLV